MWFSSTPRPFSAPGSHGPLVWMTSHGANVSPPMLYSTVPTGSGEYVVSVTRRAPHCAAGTGSVAVGHPDGDRAAMISIEFPCHNRSSARELIVVMRVSGGDGCSSSGGVGESFSIGRSPSCRYASHGTA